MTKWIDLSYFPAKKPSFSGTPDHYQYLLGLSYYLNNYLVFVYKINNLLLASAINISQYMAMKVWLWVPYA